MVNSVIKAVEVLHAFDHGTSSLTIGGISDRVGMPKSSVHRLVVTLEQLNLLSRDSQDGKYRLGPGLLQLAFLALEGLDLRQCSRPHIEWLAKALGDTVHLGVLDNDAVIYIDKIDSPNRVRMFSHVGGRAPAHCTGLGKAMLAYRSEQEIREVAKGGLTAYTPSTISDVDELLAHLAVIRTRGYAIDQGEHEAMVRCVAAPVWDYQGQVIGAVSATTVITGWEPPHLESMIAAVLEATTAISTRMGGKPSSTSAVISQT